MSPSLSNFSKLHLFLLIACLQLWSLITPVNPASTWGPHIFIFAVSATKEAWDDYNRYLSDKKAKEKEVWIVRQGVRKLALRGVMKRFRNWGGIMMLLSIFRVMNRS